MTQPAHGYFDKKQYYCTESKSPDPCYRPPSPDPYRQESNPRSESDSPKEFTYKQEKSQTQDSSTEELLCSEGHPVGMDRRNPTHGPTQTRKRIEKFVEYFFETQNTSQPQKPSDTQAGYRASRSGA